LELDDIEGLDLSIVDQGLVDVLDDKIEEYAKMVNGNEVRIKEDEVRGSYSS